MFLNSTKLPNSHKRQDCDGIFETFTPGQDMYEHLQYEEF